MRYRFITLRGELRVLVRYSNEDRKQFGHSFEFALYPKEVFPYWKYQGSDWIVRKNVNEPWKLRHPYHDDNSIELGRTLKGAWVVLCLLL